MSFNSSEFIKFISPLCNRKKFIIDYLEENGISTAVLKIKDKEHIYVKFSSKQYNQNYKIKTVIAHYDRVLNTPGANDNSIAVFLMLEWAVSLNKKQSFHNIRLIFTDGEETNQSVINQGAYEIALLYRKLNLCNDDVFVFDCMGRGEVPVIASINFPPDISKTFILKYKDLELRTIKIISQAGNGKWISLPFNFSDNASFIANGIPAVQISLLPSDEISVALNSGIPYTWKILHTPSDNFESLMNDSIELTKRILLIIENSKFTI